MEDIVSFWSNDNVDFIHELTRVVEPGTCISGVFRKRDHMQVGGI